MTEEACRLAECLARALRRAGHPDEAAMELAKELRIAAVQLLERSEGRIESRLKTKNTGHPLLEDRKVNCLHLDESGTAAIAADDEVFALGGVAMHEADVPAYVAKADELKLHFFGSIDITFHEPLMRKHDKIFSFGADPAKRAEFDRALYALVEATPFTAFGVGIRKKVFRREFVETGVDPYLPTSVYDLAIMLLLERYVDFLATHAERRLGRVHLESIGSREDAEHQAAYADLLLHGTQFVSESAFQSWVEAGCRFSPKRGSSPTELADLVARDMFEWTRSDCSVEPRYWRIISAKAHLRGDGQFGKFGIKVFPNSNIEEAVTAHRLGCGATVRTN